MTHYSHPVLVATTSHATKSVHPDAFVSVKDDDSRAYRVRDVLNAKRGDPEDGLVSTIYEPTRDYWPKYEPWMRDLLAEDARVSWLRFGDEVRSVWVDGLNGDQATTSQDLRIHPEDVPDKPDPVEELAKVLWEASNEPWAWDEHIEPARERYRTRARAAIAYFKAGEQS